MAADCKSAAPCGLRRFESSPVHKFGAASSRKAARLPGLAHVAQMVERVLGKDEVTSSILVVGSFGVGEPVGSRSDPHERSECEPDKVKPVSNGGPDAKIGRE